MKILMVNNYHYARGGAEAVMFEESNALTAQGHEVGHFSARHPLNVPTSLSTFFPDVPLIDSLTLIGKVRRYPAFISNRDVASAFTSALRAFRPDVVHFHNIYGRLTPVVADIARKECMPAVMTAHDFKLVCPAYLRLNRDAPCTRCSYGRYSPAFFRVCHKGSRLQSVLYAIESTVNGWLRRYDSILRIICPSQFMLESLATSAVPRERLRLIPNIFYPSPTQQGSSDRRYVLYSGRLSREKGVATLIRAFKGLDVDLVIAGNGPEARHLRQLAEDHGLSSRVTFLGHCSRSRVAGLISGALFIVVPSEWFENQPMAILEAFAFRKPVVASSIGGIPELVIPGRTGALFPPGDIPQLHRTLREMLVSPQLREMGDAAHSMALSRFSPSVHVEALLHVYREVAA